MLLGLPFLSSARSSKTLLGSLHTHSFITNAANFLDCVAIEQYNRT